MPSNEGLGGAGDAEESCGREARSLGDSRLTESPEKPSAAPEIGTRHPKCSMATGVGNCAEHPIAEQKCNAQGQTPTFDNPFEISGGYALGGMRPVREATGLPEHEIKEFGYALGYAPKICAEDEGMHQLGVRRSMEGMRRRLCAHQGC